MGFNLIKRVEGLRGLHRIEKLELNNNLLYRVDDVGVLRESLPSLNNLDLRNNALCDTKTYTAIVLNTLPGLTRLDGKEVTSEQRRVLWRLLVHAEQIIAGFQAVRAFQRGRNKGHLGVAGLALHEHRLAHAPLHTFVRHAVHTLVHKHAGRRSTCALLNDDA